MGAFDSVLNVNLVQRYVWHGSGMLTIIKGRAMEHDGRLVQRRCPMYLRQCGGANCSSSDHTATLPPAITEAEGHNETTPCAPLLPLWSQVRAFRAETPQFLALWLGPLCTAAAVKPAML